MSRFKPRPPSSAAPDDAAGESQTDDPRLSPAHAAQVKREHDLAVRAKSKATGIPVRELERRRGARIFVPGIDPATSYGPTCRERCRETPDGIAHDPAHHPPAAI